MVGSRFRTENITSDDAIKMLANDLKIMSRSSTDPVSLSIRVNNEAISGHLTRPPEALDI